VSYVSKREGLSLSALYTAHKKLMVIKQFLYVAKLF